MDDTTTSVPGQEAATSDGQEALKNLANFADEYYKQLASQTKESLKEIDMAEIMTPNMILGSGGGDGMFGGNGLIGGLILGSLLRNNGNLLGGNGDGINGGGFATQAGVQSVVNQSAIQQELADIKAAIPYNEAQVQLALAGVQTALTGQINNASAVTQAGFANQQNQLNQVENIMITGLKDVSNSVTTGTLLTQATIKDDGEKTRALITSQYEATLNRQLSDANAQIIALQNKQELAGATRGIEVNTTNNINQMQQQQQQQQQYTQLANLIWGLGQQIRSTNEAINVGSGTLTANPTNTNTNIR